MEKPTGVNLEEKSGVRVPKAAQSCPVTLVSVYAPTLSATPDIKDEFYDQLTATISNIPNKEQLILLGDFNARTKPQHKVSWRHLRSKHWHQLDLILVRRTTIKNVLHTRSYHSADCDTDHSLVCCKVRLHPERFHRGKKQGNPSIDVSKISQPDLVEQFAERFENQLGNSQLGDSATGKWTTLRDTMHRTALAIFRKNTSKSHDWFKAKSAEMTPIIEGKRAALMEYKRSPCEKNLQILRAARNKVKHTARRCANDYWTELSKTIQTAAITENIRGMYEGIKTAMGPTQNKTAPLRSTTAVEPDEPQQGISLLSTVGKVFTRIRWQTFQSCPPASKTKAREALIKDVLFADDAAVSSHTQQELQSLMYRSSQAYEDFGLTISLKKTIVLGQGTETPPTITINDYEPDVVHYFTYLGSTVTDNLSLDVELDKRVGKAAATLARLTTSVWSNPMLTETTKMAVYNACVISTLLYGSETWMTYARPERRLNTFHMRSLRRILGISWQDKVPNTEVLSRASLPTMFTLLRQRRLRWLGHVHRMPNGRIPKDLLFDQTKPITGTLNMQDNQIINVANPSNNKDAVNKQYIDSKLQTKADLSVVTNGLKAKLDKTTFNTEIAKKLDSTTLNAEMAKKADKDSVMLSDGSQAMTGNLDMGDKFIDNLVTNITTTTLKDYLFSGSNRNLDDTRAMTGNLNMTSKSITNLKDPQPEESFNASVNYVNKTISDNNILRTTNYKKYVDDNIARVIGSRYKNDLDYVMKDDGQFSDEEDITGRKLSDDGTFHEINNRVKRFSLGLDTGKGCYSSRFGINMYQADKSEYTVAIELGWKSSKIDYNTFILDKRYTTADLTVMIPNLGIKSYSFNGTIMFYAQRYTSLSMESPTLNTRAGIVSGVRFTGADKSYIIIAKVD
ncbi:hypothetical protein AWC38_SpisGene13952 [Stylophora pistillata]|uniref:Endonuclease/exonuclease/phosphatase domain-containing protein n=1 Tax=Stylophora pistillata TaxID=50429 RepID=A0A2B4RZ01_STYPI|nr:hypothetical protein AWC38_SpisGene13952 [Stylophora pistillata]